VNAGAWTHRAEPVLAGRALRFTIFAGPLPLAAGEALGLLEADPAFRDYLSRLLAAVEYPAFRWELPPLSTSALRRPFEFVAVADQGLEVAPEPAVFAGYFEPPADEPVRAVPNLGHTALLVVPRPIGEPATYAHLARFLRGAPPSQQQALWQCVAANALRLLGAERLWVSTAGGGVAWLHVRLERRPKYYAYRPYADSA
jgi:hypothetical protein